MPLWPFKKRRSAPPNKDTPAPPTTDDNININHDFTTPAPRPSTTITQRIRRASQQTEKVADAETPAPPQQLQRHATPTLDEKHTDHSTTARTRGSVEEDITALPVSRNLEQSPHLRPIDTGRPQIPYNFRDHSTSQTSVPRTDLRPVSRPGTAHTKRSAHDTFSVRRQSSKRRKDDDRLREEEIRGMSAPINMPKRHGDGVFRRDSKKRRNFSNLKDSNISLPYGESLHSMSTVPEQRGWELGLFDLFSPRPAIRLSGVPQYPAPSPFAQPPPSRQTYGGKEKESADAFKKRTQRIGETADEMDASDLRLLMERDAKRRERRKREQQEKLDRKLKAKVARDRSNSNKRRQEAEEARREQEVRSRVEEERRAREPLAPPTAVHPALRDEPHLGPGEVVGLGIDTDQQADEPMQNVEDPFRDPLPSPLPEHEQQQPAMRQIEAPGTYTPIETPMEDPIVETAQAVRYSQHTPLMATPPLSPSYNRAPTPSSLLSNTIERQERTASLPESPPGMAALLEERRTSEPQSVESRRTGGWATLFRRGGTKKEVKQAPASEMSFTNTSRESMSRGPIPAHLVGGDRSPFQRNKTGTPTRTQSKFREDLPEMPVSPPDSRVQSPDVPDLPVGAAAIAATHRGRASPRPIDSLNGHSRSSDVDARGAPRFDTPISPGGRTGLVSASLASVDSEGSWLASGGSLKRGSRSSQLSRSIGSLSKRPQEFVASYEDLGGQDKDAEYISRGDAKPDAQKVESRRPISPSIITGADEESIYDETPDISGGPSAPFTMHGSVRRKPTLVHREPIARSREGLFAEYATGEVATIEGGSKDDDFEPVTPGTEAQVHRATSVHFGGRGHARKVSAGSAKLLDLPSSRRQSMSPSETKRASSASLSKMG